MKNFTRKMASTALVAVLGVCSVNAQTHTWKSVNTGDGTTYGSPDKSGGKFFNSL